MIFCVLFFLGKVKEKKNKKNGNASFKEKINVFFFFQKFYDIIRINKTIALDMLIYFNYFPYHKVHPLYEWLSMWPIVSGQKSNHNVIMCLTNLNCEINCNKRFCSNNFNLLKLCNYTIWYFTYSKSIIVGEWC